MHVHASRASAPVRQNSSSAARQHTPTTAARGAPATFARPLPGALQPHTRSERMERQPCEA